MAAEPTCSTHSSLRGPTHLTVRLIPGRPSSIDNYSMELTSIGVL